MTAIRIWTSGDWAGLTALYQELAEQATLELVADATIQPEAVVHVATAASKLPGEIARIREYTSAPIVVLAAASSAELLDNAGALGTADVLLLPQAGPSVAFALVRAARVAREQLAHNGEARVVTVFSPKGGTGKSVTACNLGTVLAASGRRTLLIDLDLQFGDTAIMLGLHPEKTLHDLVTSPGNLDAGKLAGFTVRHASGLDVLAAPIRPEEAEEVNDAKVAELLDVARSAYDVVIIDTAPFLYGPTLEAIDRTTDLVLLCAPDVPTMKNVRLALQTLALLSFDDSRIRLVLNRSDPSVGLRAAEVGQILERTVDAEFPEDRLVTVAVNRATPLVEYKPDSPFAIAFTRFSATFTGQDGADRSAKRRFALGRAR
jgi:pilus assembly protein CpaE